MSIVYRGKPPKKGPEEQAPQWLFLFVSLILGAVIVGLIAMPGEPMKDYEHERDGMWCHEKTVCCDESDESTCASFESCRKAK